MQCTRKQHLLYVTLPGIIVAVCRFEVFLQLLFGPVRLYRSIVAGLWTDDRLYRTSGNRDLSAHSSDHNHDSILKENMQLRHDLLQKYDRVYQQSSKKILLHCPDNVPLSI